MAKNKKKKESAFQKQLKTFLLLLGLIIVGLIFLYYTNPKRFYEIKNKAKTEVSKIFGLEDNSTKDTNVNIVQESSSSSEQNKTTFTDEFEKVEITQEENSSLYLGNPSNAVSDLSSYTNYLMIKDQFALSYNNQTLIPNWVMWHLSTSDFGEAERGDKFIPDEALPKEWYAVVKADYQYSQYGFDRGHVCPSADRTASQEDNAVTFLMTNMIPQAPDCNRVVWKDLESYERDLAKSGKELYIAAGPYGKGGTSGSGYFESIKVSAKKNFSEQEILVPSHCWKIVLILEEGSEDLHRITEDTQVIAVFMPNEQGIGKSGSWEQFITTVDFIEEKTGYDFLSYVPDQIESVIESRVYTR